MPVEVFCLSTPRLGISWYLSTLSDWRARHLRPRHHFGTSAWRVHVWQARLGRTPCRVGKKAPTRCVRRGRPLAGTGRCGCPPVSSDPSGGVHVVGVGNATTEIRLGAHAYREDIRAGYSP